MTSGLTPRRSDRLRPPSASIEVTQRGRIVVYKLLDLNAEGAVVQGPTLDPDSPVQLALSCPGHPPLHCGAIVIRQVPVFGQVLVELALDGADTWFASVTAELS